MFKDEFHGEPVVAFRGLRAKCYAIKTEKVGEKRAKGVSKNSVVEKRMTFEHYDKCLQQNLIYSTQLVNLRSSGHEITIHLVRKEALSAFDDKRFLLEDGTHRAPAWFHKDIPEREGGRSLRYKWKTKDNFNGVGLVEIELNGQL